MDPKKDLKVGATSDVFKDEYNWLKKNIPESLFKSQIQEECTKKCPSIEKTIENYIHWLHNQKFISNTSDFYIEKAENYKEEGALMHNLYQNYFNISEEREPKEDIEYNYRINEQGNDFLGLYAPMHAYYENENYPWGIYLFPESIKQAALNLQRNPILPFHPLQDYIKLMVYAIFRHELFHYQVEKFATQQEISQGRNLYLPYHKTVYCHYYLTEHCLEEALAEHTVHKSRFLQNQVGMNHTDVLKILETHSNSLPAGYRDYKCLKYSNEKKAHQLLAYQICRTTPDNKINTINNLFDVNFSFPLSVKDTQFLDSGLEVPLHIVGPSGILKKSLNEAIRITRGNQI